MGKALNHFLAFQLLGSILLPLNYAHAEIYKWVDKRGQVHFSDKKYADENAKPIELVETTGNPNLLTFTAEADTLLAKHLQTPQGKTTLLSAGQWTAGNIQQKNNCLLRFDLSNLIAHLKTHPEKQIYRAELNLYANTVDKFYGQGSTNKDAPGHSTQKGDNGFYIKAVHNNWQEETATWADFYSSDHYTPSNIRQIPSLTVEGSGTQADKDYHVNVLPIVQHMMQVNMNSINLELTLQRNVSMAQVSFFSREASAEKRPTITVELFDSSLNPIPEN